MSGQREPGQPGPTGARGVLAEMLAEQVVVCDGAMGTMLHAAGAPLDWALPELNLSRPTLVRDVHSAYVNAGARILQTNTFGANRQRLAGVGFDSSVSEINIAGARLARQAAAEARPRVLVAGSVSPATGPSTGRRAVDLARASMLREQISALADWVDLLILETFGDLESLVEAIEVSNAECDLPIIAQMTFGDDGRTLRGEDPAEVARVLDGLDIAVLGANCTVGPAVMHDVVTELAGATSLPVSVQPNAGVPYRQGGRIRYARNSGYFGETAPEFVTGGASIVGGCCGTTPAHIRAIAAAVRGLRPVRQVSPAPRTAAGQGPPTIRSVSEPPPPQPSWPPGDAFVIAVGLTPPRGQDVADFIDSAQQFRSAGADVMAITDPAPPMARVNPIAAAVLLHERVGTEVLLPVETADRNLAALQADLLGAHALGLRTVVCRTGAPRVAGDYPQSGGSPWEIDSVGLIGALTALNDGVDWRGVATAERTRFVIGGSVNPSAADRSAELDRVAEKVSAGARFLVTDVIYDVEEAGELLTALRGRGIEVPVLASLAPFTDRRTVERFSREMPETQVRRSVLTVAHSEAQWPQQAVDVAAAGAEKLGDLVGGVVVHVPSGYRSHAVELVSRLAELRGVR